MQQIGTISARVLPGVLNPTSPAPHPVSPDALQRLDLAKVPQRLTDRMLDRLEAIAAVPLPPLAPCSEAEFMEAMTVVAVALPSQHRGEISKDVLAEAYRHALGRFSAPAIHALRDEALRACQWFPTIRECLDMLGRIAPRHPLASKRNVVLSRIANERQARFDEAMHRLSTGKVSQDEIDALPDAWKRVGETRSLLWRCECGSYALRRQRHPITEQEAAA